MFGSTRVANINELQLYGEKLFNIYTAMNFSSTEARDQVVEDLNKNTDVVDGYAYLKRDINAFKSIGSVDNVPKIKEYIIKNNLPLEDNNPKDYFLRHNGAGQFEIRRRIDIAPVYDKNNKPIERRIQALHQLLSLDKPTTKAIPYSNWPSPPEIIWT